MEARILKLQELAKNRKASIEKYDLMREEMIKKDEERRRVEFINQQLQKVSYRFRGKTWSDYQIDNLEQKKVKTIVDRYAQTFNERLKEGSSLIFKGKHGTGKTLLSFIVYQSIAKEGFSVHYESSLEFITHLLESKFKSQQQFLREFEIYTKCQFLVIDEVTESISKNGFPSEIEKQLLFRLINQRYENQLCTLVITNRDDTEFISRLGEGTIDRLTEKGMTLAFMWDSYRKK